MITLKFDVTKAGFFDRDAVINAVARAERRVLSSAGAFVRQRARTSLRYRARPSAPGSPPSAHRSAGRTKINRRTGAASRQMVSPLREFLFFSYDQAARVVVIGPALLNGAGGAQALRALEYGGLSFVVERGRRKPIVVQTRPFMRPALAAELPKIAEMWRNRVRA